MKITKYGHACLLLDTEKTRLIIDPGSFTTLPNNLKPIDYIIVTEEHFDHFSEENIDLIAKQNPDVQIFTTNTVKDSLNIKNLDVVSVSGEQTFSLAGLSVTLRERDHAVVHQKSPCKSLTVTIDNTFYYPSDTYEITDERFKVLALPTSGPWFKVTESIDFANKIDAHTIISTHDSLNSKAGNDATNRFITGHIDSSREFVHLADGKSIEF